MKCTEAQKNILLQDSGELGASGICKLEVHLADCESCRQFKQALLESANLFDAAHEPSVRTVQDVLRTARTHAPTRKHEHVLGWKPSLAMAASVLIVLGLAFGNYNSNKVGLELMVSDAQLLEPEDQVVSIMYDGLSEDDLAFNFLMTYEENFEG